MDEITGLLNYDSRLIRVHSGTLNYTNGNLKAVFLKNGQPGSCVIDTMNGHDFIITSHFGVRWMGGAGCSGNLWAPGEIIAIDFTDDTFRPADTVQVDIMDTTTSQTISHHV